MTPEERKAYSEGHLSTIVPDSRRDIFARLTHYAHK